ncbi:MAG TPA: peptidoglycan-binding protein, partial [Vitreimonas sp.]|nr:peptidoglycan-binding protein [Vitreimonas sp.]
TQTVENLNYSAEQLRRTWPNRFRTDEIAREYAHQPERIANFVYSNRLGNGPPESGDGWTFRGRGFFQLTGRKNYREFGRISGFDLEGDPAQLEDVKKSIEVAAAYFQSVGLGPYADADDAAAVSRGVNRGDPRSSEPAHAEAERIQWTSQALDLVKDPQQLLARAANEEVLRIGATGERVRLLQQDLTDLRYPVGVIDGVFGPATRRALINFQEERRLEITGVVDAPTRAALEGALGPIVVNAPPAQAPLGTAPIAIDPTPAPPLPTPEPVVEAEAGEPEAAPVEPAPTPESEAVAEAPAAPAPETVAETSPAPNGAATGNGAAPETAPSETASAPTAEAGPVSADAASAEAPPPVGEADAQPPRPQA